MQMTPTLLKISRSSQELNNCLEWCEGARSSTITKQVLYKWETSGKYHLQSTQPFLQLPLAHFGALVFLAIFHLSPGDPCSSWTMTAEIRDSTRTKSLLGPYRTEQSPHTLQSCMLTILSTNVTKLLLFPLPTSFGNIVVRPYSAHLLEESHSICVA